MCSTVCTSRLYCPISGPLLIWSLTREFDRNMRGAGWWEIPCCSQVPRSGSQVDQGGDQCSGSNHCGYCSNKCLCRRWECQVNLLHIFKSNLKYLSNTTFCHPFDSLVTGMSWPDDPVIVKPNVNFSSQKGNEKQPEQETLHDELKVRNPRVHIRKLSGRDQRSICRTGCLGAGQCFATQLREINMLS